MQDFGTGAATSVPVAEGADDTAKVLERCLRDLSSLMALPALWSASDPDAIVRTLAETLEELLDADVLYVETGTTEADVRLLRVTRRGVDPDAPEWRPLLAFPERSGAIDRRTQTCATPVGERSLARIALGFYGHAGHIVVGSPRAGFPTDTDLVLMRAAATFAATGLRSARLAQERSEALRAKDEFLAMLGHELRNPLAPIVTVLGLLRLRKVELPELAIIERQVDHLNSLVNDLLDITRVMAGKVAIRRAVVDVAQAAQRAVEMASPLLEQRSHHFEMVLPPPAMALVDGDAVRLSQIVANLLINAAKYTDPHGRVRLEVGATATEVVVSVTDNGIGIEDELLGRLFGLFQQGRTTAERAGGGLGIGLALVKSLVDLHGGRVVAESEGAGRGSRFVVTLPRCGSAGVPADASPRAVTTPAAAAPRKILVVDDNGDAAQTIANLLSGMNHDVRTADDAVTALRVLQSFDAGVVILDIGLPGIDGYQLARLIRERAPSRNIRLIALTGYGLASNREASTQAGIESHLLKPVKADALVAAIESTRDDGS